MSELIERVHELENLQYDNQPVVTLSMVDELHGRPEGTAKRNFHRNRGKLLDGVDYFEVPGDEFRTLGFKGHGGGSDITLLTQAGYCMLVKSFRDDLAWDVQRALVNHYFRSTEQLCSDHLIGVLLARCAAAAPIGAVCSPNLIPGAHAPGYMLSPLSGLA